MDGARVADHHNARARADVCACQTAASSLGGYVCQSINQSITHMRTGPSFFFFGFFLLLLGSQPCVGRRRRPVPSLRRRRRRRRRGGQFQRPSSPGTLRAYDTQHKRKKSMHAARPTGSIDQGGTTGRSSPQQTIMQPWDKCWNLGFWECQSINQGIAVPSEVGNADMDRCSSLQALIIPRSFLEFPRPVAMWPPPLPGGPYPFHAI